MTDYPPITIGNGQGPEVEVFIRPYDSIGQAQFDLRLRGNLLKTNNITRAQAMTLIERLQRVFPKVEVPEPFLTTGVAGCPVRASVDLDGAGEPLPYTTLLLGPTDQKKEYQLASLTKANAIALRDWLSVAIDVLPDR